MYKITAICDKCKQEETQESSYFNHSQNHWQEIRIESLNQYATKAKVLLCSSCCDKLGLLKPNNLKEIQPTPLIQDRLLDIIAEIVQAVSK